MGLRKEIEELLATETGHLQRRAAGQRSFAAEQAARLEQFRPVIKGLVAATETIA